MQKHYCEQQAQRRCAGGSLRLFQARHLTDAEKNQKLREMLASNTHTTNATIILLFTADLQGSVDSKNIGPFQRSANGGDKPTRSLSPLWQPLSIKASFVDW
jgi:hypothetical protein